MTDESVPESWRDESVAEATMVCDAFVALAGERLNHFFPASPGTRVTRSSVRMTRPAMGSISKRP
jgi:hypothetical protein